MSILSPTGPRASTVHYPESDGKPMAENTLQFQWIVTIKGGLEVVFRDRADVFVAGDLLWYPVEDNPKVRAAPDAMVVFGRPKGHRGSYLQWLEDNIPPQVVFEVRSPGNRFGEMMEKFRFYEKYGVEEYYLYDPDHVALEGWQRSEGRLVEVEQMDGHVSPRLGVRFNLAEELILTGPDGRRFATYEELARQREQAEQALEVAQQAAEAAEQAAEAAEQARDRADDDARRARERADRLAAQLRAAGIEPQE